MELFTNRNRFSSILLTSLLLTVIIFVSFFGTPVPVEEGTGNYDKTINISENDSASIYLNAVHINTQSAEGRALQKPAVYFTGKKMHLVKFSGPIQPGWYNTLTATGAEVIDYIPNYAYLVFVNYTALKNLQAEAKKEKSPIVWEAPYLPEYRIAPDVYGKDSKGNINFHIISFSTFKVQLYADETTNISTLNDLQKQQPNSTFKDKQSISHYINLTVDLTAAGLKALSLREEVISISPYFEPKRKDESQNVIMTGQLNGNVPSQINYLSYLNSKGFTQV